MSQVEIERIKNSWWDNLTAAQRAEHALFIRQLVKAATQANAAHRESFRAAVSV